MVATKLFNNIYKFNEQYFYSELVNTYLIELDNHIILFDIPTYSKLIEKFILDFNKPIHCFLSHGPCGISDGLLWQQKLRLKVYLNKIDINNPWLSITPDIFYDMNYILDILEDLNISDKLKVISTPGHTPGSICLLFNEKVLFTGDTVAGDQKEKVKDFFKSDSNGDVRLRFNSCKQLLKYNFESILPFHYTPILKDAKSKLSDFVKLNSLAGNNSL